MSAADQPARVAQLAGVLEIHRGDPADAFDINIRGQDLLAEGERRQDGELRAGVDSVDVGAGIGLGVPEALRFGDQFGERHAALLHLGEDVVAGAVEDSVKCGDAIA